jgi:aminoacrylate peracid reductase
VKVANMVFVSGTIPNDPEGNVVGKGDITRQTEYVIESVRSVLEAGGARLDDIVMNHIFITDFANYAKMNEVYARFFAQIRPARYCIKAELVNPDWLVEIASVAVISQ